MRRDHPWIHVHEHELTRSKASLALYVEMARILGEEARSVPAFFVCGRLLTGYDSPQGMGRQLLERARMCRKEAGSAAAGGVSASSGGNPTALGGNADDPIRLPIVG